MPIEICGKLFELNIKPGDCEGVLAVETDIPVIYGSSKEMKKSYIRVPFILDSKDAIDVIRKSDNELKLIGRFDNDGDALVFFVYEAEEK